MGTKYKTSYRKGDQLFNCYGLRNNRFLLVNYGFCLRNNKYNSLGFKVFVNIKPKQGESEQTGEEDDESRYQKVIRLKKDKLCEGKPSTLSSSRPAPIPQSELDLHSQRS